MMFRKTVRLAVLFVGIFVLVLSAASQKKSKLKPEKDPQYQYEKAVVAWNYELEDEALKYLDLALSLDPYHFQSYNLRGLVYFKKKNLSEAAAAFERCVELKPDFAEAHNNLGTAYHQMGRLEEAEAEFLKSYGLDGNANSSFNLAKVYFSQKKMDQALEYIQKSIAKDGRVAGSHNFQGVILNELGRYAEAVASYQEALRIAPGDAVVRVNLAVAYINMEEFARARELLEKTLSKVQDEALQARINEYLKFIKDKNNSL